MPYKNGQYYTTKNLSGKSATGQATAGILARECDEGALKQVLKNTRPQSGNASQWNNSEKARARICGKFTKWQSNKTQEIPTNTETQYLLKLSEWAKEQSVGSSSSDPGSVSGASMASTVASEPGTRRRRALRKSRKNRKSRRRNRRAGTRKN